MDGETLKGELGTFFMGSNNRFWFLSLLFIMICVSCSGPMAPGRKMETDWGPLYAAASNESEDSYGYHLLFHLIKGDKTPERQYSHVIPFYFSSEDEDHNLFTLAPPFYYRNRDGFDEDLFILLSGLKKRGYRKELFLLYPFIKFTEYENQPNRGGFYLFPLIDYSNDENNKRLRLADVAGLFNLLDVNWDRPIVSENAEDKGAAFSLLNVLGLVQLAGGGDLGAYNDFQLVSLFSSEKLSLFQHHWKKDTRDEGRTILFPFYWHLKDETTESYHYWPIYGYDKGEQGAYTGHVLYPLFSYNQDETNKAWRIDFLWPLGRFMERGDADFEFRAMPFYMNSEKEGDSLIAITPLYWRQREKNGYAMDLLYPLFSSFSYGEDDHTFSLAPVFKVFFDTPDTRVPGRSQYDFLWPLMGFGSSHEKDMAWLFPLFSYSSDPSHKKWGFLLDFFKFTSHKAHNTFTFLWFIPISWGGDGDA